MLVRQAAKLKSVNVRLPITYSVRQHPLEQGLSHHTAKLSLSNGNRR